MLLPDPASIILLVLAGIGLFLIIRFARRSPADPKVQLDLVRGDAFSARPVLGAEELKVMGALDKWCRERRQRFRVFPQVAMGEYLSVEDDGAFRSINSKRVDFLIVDRRSQPVVAVEYQGGGHYQGTAELRDQVKKTALESAAIPLVEIFPEDGEEQILAKLTEMVGEA